MVYNGKSHSNGWFGGTPSLGNHHIYIEILQMAGKVSISDFCWKIGPRVGYFIRSAKIMFRVQVLQPFPPTSPSFHHGFTTLWCHQIWLAGKSPINGGFKNKTIDFCGPFSSTPCEWVITGGYVFSIPLELHHPLRRELQATRLKDVVAAGAGAVAAGAVLRSCSPIESQLLLGSY